MTKHIERFSSRVENYIKYRPGYPQGIVNLLEEECGLTLQSVIADIGSGPGNLSKLFLENGNAVYGVEPNRDMREAGERLLNAYRNFKSVVGTAEATTLESDSIDFVTAGQAFHWFDRKAARTEFMRILKPGGWAVIIWNDRWTKERAKAHPFLLDYDKLLVQYGTDYETVKHTNVDDSAIAEFFAPRDFHMKILENRQVFDFESLKGRLLSSSYTPEEGHPNYRPMLEELERIFREHERNGQVAFEYDTKIYYGQLSIKKNEPL